MHRFQRVSVLRYAYIASLVIFMKVITKLGTKFVSWFWIQHCFSNRGYGWNVWTLKLTAGSYVTVHQTHSASSYHTTTFNFSPVSWSQHKRNFVWCVLFVLKGSVDITVCYSYGARHKMDLIGFLWGLYCPNWPCLNCIGELPGSNHGQEAHSAPSGFV
jgi:hypothetical protein